MGLVSRLVTSGPLGWWKLVSMTMARFVVSRIAVEKMIRERGL